MDKDSKKDIPVVTTKVRVKKESEISRFKKNFFAEDGASVKQHIFSTVIIPGIQRLFTDVVKNGVDWLIYGTKTNSSRSGIRGVSYTNYYDRNRPNTGFGSSSQKTNTSKNGVFSMNEIIFDDRGEAEAVLERMREAISRYTVVSVADFYDMVGVKHAFTDNKWGWENLESAVVGRRGNGYFIQFPKARPVES